MKIRFTRTIYYNISISIYRPLCTVYLVEYLVTNMASFFGLGGPAAKVEITLDNSDGRKSIEVSSEEAQQELMIYSGSDKVSGTVKVIIPSGKKLEHLGIKVEVIGTIGRLPLLPVGSWIPTASLIFFQTTFGCA